MTDQPHGIPHPPATTRWWQQLTVLKAIHIFIILFVLVNNLLVSAECLNSIGRTWGGFSFNYYFKISGVISQLNKADIRLNDRIVLVNGQPPINFEQAIGQKNRVGFGAEAANPDMTSAVYTIQRTTPGSSTPSQRIVQAPTFTFDVSDFLSFYGVGFLVGWLMFAVGIFIYFFKQDERPSQVFMLAMVNGSMVVITGYEGLYTYRVHPLDLTWFEGIYGFALALLGATAFQLSANFPQVKPIVRRIPALQYLLYPFSIALGAIYTLQAQAKIGDIYNHRYVTPVGASTWAALFAGLGLLVFLAGVIYDWRTSSNPTVRRQARLVVAGSLLGIGPILFLYTIPIYVFGQQLIDFNTGYAFLIIFPITVAYAIIRYKLFDLNYVLRRSFAYVISSGVVLGIYFILVTLLQGAFTRLTGQDTVISIIISTLSIAILFNPVRDRLQRVVDRFFFRERFVFREAMVEFGEQIHNIYDQRELSRKLVLEVATIMDLEDAALYLKRRGSNDRTLYLSDSANQLDPQRMQRGPRFIADSDIQPAPGTGWQTTTRLPLDLEQWMVEHNQPLNVAALPAGLPPSAAPLLQLMFASAIIIVIPLVSQSQLLGLMLLQRKRNGAGVLREDMDLLNALIPQAVLTLRNAQLLTEATERERVQRELEIAREIQQGLFPKVIPQPPGFRISAVCLPAQETSGDFYDFVEMQDRLGLIVADACGKSVPAAMMMSLARNTMRSEIGHYVEPAPALTEGNRWLVKDLGDRRYVALTYMLLNSKERSLTLGNAGGLSPLLRRDGKCEYITPGGLTLPLGVQDGLEYQQNIIPLCPRDLILAYTDGVVEATNAAGELFSFERLEQLITGYDQSGGADGLVKSVLNALTAFCVGMEQADDITVVAVEVLN